MLGLIRIPLQTIISTRLRLTLAVLLTFIMSILLFVSLYGHSQDNISIPVNGDEIKYFFPDPRKESIRDSFKKAWTEFIEMSKGADEINSVTGEPKTTWGGWGVTLIDSLDTLFIMNLTKEFEEATEVLSHVDFTKGNITTAFFEVVIRNLGGLISAYDLSGKKVFLDKAIALADVLMKDFESPIGFPYRNFNFRTQRPVKSGTISLASVGTCQLEFTRLSLITGDIKYQTVVLNILDKLESNKRKAGLFNTNIDITSGAFITREVSYGSEADSFYEYLLKIPIMIGKHHKYHDKILKIFSETMDYLQKELIRPCFGNHFCLGKLDVMGNFESRTEHLMLFIPGLLLLGGEYMQNKTLTDKAITLLDSFMEIPSLSITGLAPEWIGFSKDKKMIIIDKRNSLRPELAESLFYAHRATHSKKYRDLTWKLFQSFETYSRVRYGYSDYKDVTKITAKQQVEGDMPSFFFAETFKYLYLTFCDDDIISLENWVFNTEAHPFRRS